MGEVEAAGDLVTGTMLGRAVEPGAGEADGHIREGACLNCGTDLAGPYCFQCGQRGHVHRTIRAFFHDLMHGVLHFEGKIWRTLPMLAWRPGQLTRRYIEGQRARFVSPIALFLFSVFLMFAVVSAIGGFSSPNIDSGARQDLATAERQAVADIAALDKARAERARVGKSTAAIEGKLRDQRESLQIIQTLRGRGLTEAILKSEKTSFRSSIPWIEQAYHKARQNPQLLLYKLKTNSYKWSWALIPLSVPFLWLVFPFSRRFRTYDHVVFITYSLCFMSLLVVLATAIAASAISDGMALFLLLIPPFHIYRQLRGAYSVGRWGALWRTVVLLIGAAFVLAMFALLIIAVGEMG